MLFAEDTLAWVKVIDITLEVESAEIETGDSIGRKQKS
jgi:hypothetical protein